MSSYLCRQSVHVHHSKVTRSALLCIALVVKFQALFWIAHLSLHKGASSRFDNLRATSLANQPASILSILDRRTAFLAFTRLFRRSHRSNKRQSSRTDRKKKQNLRNCRPPDTQRFSLDVKSSDRSLEPSGCHNNSSASMHAQAAPASVAESKLFAVFLADSKWLAWGAGPHCTCFDYTSKVGGVEKNYTNNHKKREWLLVNFFFFSTPRAYYMYTNRPTKFLSFELGFSATEMIILSLWSEQFVTGMDISKKPERFLRLGFGPDWILVQSFDYGVSRSQDTKVSAFVSASYLFIYLFLHLHLPIFICIALRGHRGDCGIWLNASPWIWCGGSQSQHVKQNVSCLTESLRTKFKVVHSARCQSSDENVNSSLC